MINKTTYLLICLIEEAAEVIQRACKAIRFGIMETQASAYKKLNDLPTSPNLEHTKTNQRRLQDELTDMRAIIEILVEQEVLASPVTHSIAVEDKKRKIQKYMKYSRLLGLLEAEIPHD